MKRSIYHIIVSIPLSCQLSENFDGSLKSYRGKKENQGKFNHHPNIAFQTGKS